MAIQTTRWDSAEHLKTDEDIQLYLEACIEEAEAEPTLLLHALNVIARAQKMHSTVTGVNQLGFDGNLDQIGDPSFIAVIRQLKALGFKLSIQPMAQ
ncbi:MAG: addiction module antidote protein [Leptolyngbyaceae cyanobacterium]